MLAVLLLSGCATVPSIEQLSGAVTCVSVQTLTARTTTVYVAADSPGTVVVQPDCTVAVTR